MAEELEDQVQFVGVSNNDTVEAGIDFRDEFGVPYPLAHAPEVWQQFDVPYQPVTIILGPTGEILERFDGPVTYEGLKEALRQVTT